MSGGVANLPSPPLPLPLAHITRVCVLSSRITIPRPRGGPLSPTYLQTFRGLRNLRLENPRVGVDRGGHLPELFPQPVEQLRVRQHHPAGEQAAQTSPQQVGIRSGVTGTAAMVLILQQLVPASASLKKKTVPTAADRHDSGLENIYQAYIPGIYRVLSMGKRKTYARQKISAPSSGK